MVIEERRLRVDNEIAGTLDEELCARAFKAHPYRWPVIGWMADIEHIRREDCAEYFRTYYAPNNAVMFVVGDFDTRTDAREDPRACGRPSPRTSRRGR